MTMRLTGAYDSLKKSNGKALCWLTSIHRTDGVVIRFTDHDRNLTVGGDLYKSATSVITSDEERENNIRSSNQDYFGFIDGLNVKLSDMLGHRYRGARVEQRLVDFRYPWLEYFYAVKRVGSIRFSGSTWIAKTESLSRSISMDKGGRFLGVNSTSCPYRLGGKYCRASISSFIQTGVRVSSIITPKFSFQTATSTWVGAPENRFYAEGEFEFIWAAAVVTGTITLSISPGAGSVKDTTKTWAANEHVGRYVRLLNAANGYVAQYRRIVSNTADTLVVNTPFTTSHASGQNYDIAPECQNAGLTVPIIDYALTNRQINLYFPTPMPISVGDSGIVRPGCDGLFTTCKVKYANQVNFGGIDVDAPLPTEIAEVPSS